MRSGQRDSDARGTSRARGSLGERQPWRRPPRLLSRHHRSPAAGALARQGDDAGGTSAAVSHAMRYVKAGRRLVFEGVRARRRAPWTRVARAIRRLPRNPDGRAPRGAGRPAPAAVDALLPGTSRVAVLRPHAFPWFGSSSARRPRFVRSFSRILPRSSERVFEATTQSACGLAGERGEPRWNGFYFFRHGERRKENHALCPRTSAALDSLPLVRIRDNAPEVMFSVLTPGSHILPHRGVTNTRVVCHLPLVVPEDCALVVGASRTFGAKATQSLSTTPTSTRPGTAARAPAWS